MVEDENGEEVDDEVNPDDLPCLASEEDASHRPWLSNNLGCSTLTTASTSTTLRAASTNGSHRCAVPK